MHINDKSTKLPKRIAGVRITRSLRISGGKLIDIARNPLVATLTASLVVAAAAVIKNSEAVRAAAVKAKDKARDTLHHLTKPAETAQTAIEA